MPRHNGSPMWHPQHRSVDRNLASTSERYHLVPPTPTPTTFRTHWDVVSKIYPRMNPAEFTRLSDGGSRETNIHRYLSIVDDGEFWCHPTGAAEPGYRRTGKSSIILVTEQPTGEWLVSVPYTQDDLETEIATIVGDDGDVGDIPELLDPPEDDPR